MKTFKLNEIIRYSHGETALAKIVELSENNNPMYGKQFFGETIGFYENNIEKASTKDIENWNKYNND